MRRSLSAVVVALLFVAAFFVSTGTASAAPRPATAYGTQNVPVRNYSNTACGAIGVYHAGFTGLGYDSLLYAGRNANIAGFFSNGPLVDVYQWAGSGFRYVGRFGAGQHPFGPGSYYLDRVGC